jgi:hypothetical protein
MEKVALCFLISGDHVLNKEHIWKEWVEPNQDIIQIHFHYADKTKIKSQWIRLHAMPEKLIAPTDYFHVVPAYLSLISYAIASDPFVKWFCFLTDACSPIITPQKFRELFFRDSDKSIFKWGKAHWNVYHFTRANLRHLPKSQRLSHDPWFTLTRVDAELCLKYASECKKMYFFICQGVVANESIFAIILLHYDRLQHVLNKGVTITDWTRMTSMTSPYVFKTFPNGVPLQDIKYIQTEKEKNDYYMFIRKVHTSFPDALIRVYTQAEVEAQALV